MAPAPQTTTIPAVGGGVANAVERLVETLVDALPAGPRMSHADKEFWLEISDELGPENIAMLAKVVAFMRKVEGF